MSVNLEIKGQLAKLLATEDLLVEHKQVETAMFNVETRVLTLPMWEKATNAIYDMLVSHEVGHALFTPDEDWDNDVPKQFLNVTEDVRIEKLMKRKYAGLSKTFYRGYSDLNKDDFFCLEGENIDEMNLADRVNLYFKIGSFISITFSEEEKNIVNIVERAESFQDAKDAARILYEYCKKEIRNGENTQIESNSGDQKAESSSSENVSESFNYGSNDDGHLESSEKESDENGGGESDLNESSSNPTKSNTTLDDNEQPLDDISVKTDEILNDNLKNLINSRASSSEYIEIPDVNLKTIINSNAEVHGYINEFFDNYLNDSRNPSIFDAADSEYSKFKNSSKKEVAYLVKEFECKKSAKAYSRSINSRTGILDCSKLHTYKYNEDLFKKVTIVPEGKNHGLIFILDWSGSMGEYLIDTIKQLFNLIWFCKKVNIPFSVYAFTGEYNTVKYTEDGKAIMLEKHYTPKDGLLYVNERFSLMEFFTSDVSQSVLETQMKSIWRCAYSMYHYVEYQTPHKLSLSGTPLNESLISLHKIIPHFRKKYSLEKVNCVILTDGESNYLIRHKKIITKVGDDYIGTCRIHENNYLRNRKTGNTHKIPYDWIAFTDLLLKNLGEEFPNTNFIGIRVVANRDANQVMRRYCGEYGDEIMNAMKQWKKEKTFSIKTSGYSKYFGISSTSLSQECEFEVKDDATKSQIKSAFIKSLKVKKTNKRILGEFIDLVV